MSTRQKKNWLIIVLVFVTGFSMGYARQSEFPKFPILIIKVQ